MARELMTIRVERPLRARLSSSARRRHLSLSATVRVALHEWLAQDEAGVTARPYDALADLLGRAHGRDPLRATRRSGRGAP